LLLLLGAQRPALRLAGRPRPRRALLRPGAAAGPVAGLDAPGAAGPAAVRRRRRFGGRRPVAGAGLPPARRRLVRAVLDGLVLPAFGAVALALGQALVHSRWRASRATAGAAIASLAVVAVAHYLAVPWYAWYRSPMSRPAEVRGLCADPGATIVCYPRNCDSV